MAVEQIDSFLSSNAERQFELIKEAAPQLIALGKSIVDTNSRISKSESSRSDTVKGLRDDIKGLDEEMKQFLKLSLEYQYQTSETAKKEALLRKQIQDARKANQEYAKSVTETTDAYRKLEIEHKKLEGQAKQLGAIYGANSKEFKEAAAAANEYGNKLKAIDAGLGNHRRNVGNYASGFNTLQNAISQIGRELPNFGQSLQVGILSLSNQWGQLSDGIREAVARNKELIAQGKPTVSVLKQITVALISWQTAINVGIALVTAYSDEISDFIQNISKADAALKKSKEESIKAFKQEETQIRIWKAEIESGTTSQERLVQIKDKFISQYPGTKSIIEGETNLQDGLTKAIERVSGALLIQAKIRSYANAIAETETKKLLREMSGGDVAKGIFYSSIFGVGKGAAMATSEVVTEYDKALDILNKKLQESIAEFQNTGGDLLLGSDKEKKVREEKLNEFYNQYINSLKERNKAQKQYDEQQIQQGLAVNQSIINDEEAFLDDRLKALEEYYQLKTAQDALNEGLELKNLQDEKKVLLQKEKDYQAGKLKLTDLQHKTLLNEIETNNINQRAINQKWETILIQDEINKQEKRLGIIKKYGQEEVKAALANLKAISGNFQGSGSRTRDQAAVIREQIAYLEEFRAILAAEGVNVDALTEKIDELNAALGKTPKQWELTARSIADVVREIQPIVNELAGLVNDIYQRRLENLDKESEKIRQNGEKEIENINQQALTQEEKERRIRIAQAKTDAEQKQIEQRRKQAEYQQASFNRAASIAEIIGKTALAVITALTEGDPYTKAARAAIAGALGAAQLARVIATPLPSYAEGTLDHPGGKARVGEAGPEMIVTPDGKIRSVSRETVLDLPQHSKVFNEEQLKQMGMFYPKMFKDSHNDYNFERLEDVFKNEIRSLTRVIKRKNNNAYVTVQGVDNYKKIHTRGK